MYKQKTCKVRIVLVRNILLTIQPYDKCLYNEELFQKNCLQQKM